MTGVYFKGRLGNQLFQYVFLLYLKSRSKNSIVFFPNPHHAYLSKYFDLGTYNNLILGSKLYSLVTRAAPLIMKAHHVHSFVTPKHIKPQSFTIYHGYFQTDFYYNSLEVKPQLSLKTKYIRQFESLYGDIFRNEKTIVVHIRRTDYLKYGKRDISLPLAYFKQRLAEIPNLDSYRVFFVSDEIDLVKREFRERSNYIFSSNEEIIDFQIIQNADIAIISNSSFSWWAAFLSKKQNVVYAPKNWLAFRIGAEHPKGVMTSRFIWKDVAD